MKLQLIALGICIASFVGGCATTTDHVLDNGSESQLQKRSYESRTFDTNDKAKVMRGVIATLQDLGFAIDKADMTLGTVSGSKFEQHVVKMTVSVRAKGKDQMVVRANAQYGLEAIKNPKQYQDFFNSLEKSLFLSANTGE